VRLDINKIESESNLQSVTWKGVNLWPIFKTKILSFSISSSRVLRAGDYYKVLLKSFGYGFSHIFRLNRFKFYLFSSSSRRVLTQGRYEERVLEGAITMLREEALLFENPVPKGHFNRSQIRSKNVISEAPFFFVQSLIMLVLKIFNVGFESECKIRDIFRQYELPGNYKSIFYRFLSQYYFMRFLLKLHKPEFGVFVCSYVYFGYILAFREAGIKTIEMQHGIINKSHAAYNYTENFGKLLFPEFLFSYGDSVNNVINNNFVLNRRIFTVGYYYLDKLKSSAENRNPFDVLANQFRLSICFTGIPTMDRISIDLLNELAGLEKSYLIIYLPRHRDKVDPTLSKHRNFKIVNDNTNTYDVICHCDIHSTIYSTCALEALALGKVNILFDHDGLARENIFPVVGENNFVRYINDVIEFRREIEAVKNLHLSEKDIKQSISQVFATGNHVTLLANAFSEIS